MKSQEIRSKFLSFFEEKEHLILPSAPMVLKDDPTLMFVNSGMAPFKEYFLGNAQPKKNRIADSQKCLRVSGKHNDLEEVGYDTYHHTLFEMLGNWSFGDYFKKEAISWAWELLTSVYGIDKDLLYVTVFEGSTDADRLNVDQEALDLWKLHISEDRILMGNKSDNFWEMGDQGPCGPCSEIHVDLRSEEEKARVDGKTLVNKDHPQVVEIWNLVFMQYNRKADKSLEILPNKHIDTGMGFERLCMVLQGVQSNYDTDVFKPLIREIETIANVKYRKDKESDIAIRVIADHVRAVAFSIADGQLPSNTGAGYVIRRILRRAIRYGFTFLDQKDPFIFKLIETLSNQMGEAFPELKSQERLIENVVREEEHSFLRTLEQGLLLLEKVISEETSKTIDGSKAFELYDTYGFPLDLTQLIARENGYSVDINGFNAEMKKQKERSRAASASETSDWVEVLDQKHQEFIGYDTLEADVKLTRYRKITNNEGAYYQLAFNKTPFYPEGGGQVGDVGYLELSNGDLIYITDTKKENNIIIHSAKRLPKHLDETMRAIVNPEFRRLSQCNHTATHLLHQALRAVLGTHVEQKGSLVKPKSLRFDFSHFSKVDADQLQEIENFVNARIRERLPLQEQRDISMQKALDEGAIALFGEKYGDSVRAVRFGKSMELCGGTHVQNTGEIWHFKIQSESAVASGIRRIEAITNVAVNDYFEEVDHQYEAVKKLLKNSNDPVKAVQTLQDENAALKKEVESLLRAKAKNLKGELKAEISDLNGVQFLAKKIDLDPASLKDLCFDLGRTYDNLFLLFGAENNGKATLSCYISKALVDNKDLNAGAIVRSLGKYIQGGGGGQPFFATAGGKNADGIDAALKAVENFIK